MIPDVPQDPEANRAFIIALMGFGCGALVAAALAVPGLLLVCWWTLRAHG